MKKTASLLPILLLLSILLIPSPQKAYAKTKTSDELQVTYEDPLFPSSVIWYPGLSITKSFTVKNLGSSSQTVSIKATNTSQTGNIADVFLFKVTEARVNHYGGTDGKTLKNFWDEGQISLSDLNGKETTSYDITITMLTSAGNEYQGKQARFDLIVGFVGTPTQVTITGAGGGGIGGISPTTCSDTPPSTAPILTSAVAGVNSVTLTWTSAGEPVSYYLIAYGTNPGSYQYGNPNVGGKGTTSYTVTGLSGGTTYYFVVRAGNGCAPGPFSNELTSTPGGGFLAGIPAGFAPGILGISTPEGRLTPKISPSSKIKATPKSGQIKGEKTSATCQNCHWWQIFLAEIILLSGYYFLILKRYRVKKLVLIASLIPILTYLIFLRFNKNCLVNLIFIQSAAFFCHSFWLVNLLVFIAYILLYSVESRR